MTGVYIALGSFALASAFLLWKAIEELRELESDDIS